jgi:methanol--5-hydroxybenzimidazolylcobamide Co-methyltransferase
MKFKKLAITDKKDLIYGSAIHPVKTPRGLDIGGGQVYPELNFTLPAMTVDKNTLPEIKKQYQEIVRQGIERALHLESNGLVFEFETLLEMTLHTDMGVELVKVMIDVIEDYKARENFKSELRLTPNDIRDFVRPPKMRSGAYLDRILDLFEKGGQNGGDLFSIESTGGKEIFDDAVMMCDIKQVMFSLIVLGVRDMRFLWKKIVEIADTTNRIPAGDTACGFGNTAMVLAEKGYIPKVFAAIVRVITVIRTLVAVEEGAMGPDKDCGYEGPYLKAITGIPISMEGRTAACAHLSPVGNIAGACADLWSNESIQNIKLLGGMAPTISLEQLEYDVRLYNQASQQGTETRRMYQQMLIESDVHRDPQAFVLAPDTVIRVAEEMVKGQTHLDAAKRGALKALDLIEQAIKAGTLYIEERETIWIDRIRSEIDSIPDTEDQFIASVIPTLDDSKWTAEEYGL